MATFVACTFCTAAGFAFRKFHGYNLDYIKRFLLEQLIFLQNLATAKTLGSRATIGIFEDFSLSWFLLCFQRLELTTRMVSFLEYMQMFSVLFLEAWKNNEKSNSSYALILSKSAGKWKNMLLKFATWLIGQPVKETTSSTSFSMAGLSFRKVYR